MNHSFPKQNLPLRVVLHRVGEATLHQYHASRTRMDSSEAAYQFWQEVVADDPSFEPDKEHLVVVLLNGKLRTLGYHVVSVGCLNETIAHPREIFRPVIVAGAYGFLLMHNHPSGDPTLSTADHQITRRIREGAELLSLQFCDHVIVGGERDGEQPYYSFRGAKVL